VSQLPSARGDGAPITTFIELDAGARIAHLFAAHAGIGVLFSTKGGNGFVCQAADLVGRTRQGKQFLTLDEEDAPLEPALIPSGMTQVLCVSEGGRLLSYPLEEVKALRNGGRGVILMGLEPKESLLHVIVHGDSGVVVEGVGRAGKPITREMSARELSGYAAARARKGRLLEPRVRQARLRALRGR
jgi:topoisomerase-4 subunit A